MTAPFSAARRPIEWETSTEAPLIYTEADVRQWVTDGRWDGYGLREDESTVATLFRSEVRGSVTLNRPLCAYCEEPLDHGVCAGCEIVFVTPGKNGGIWA